MEPQLGWLPWPVATRKPASPCVIDFRVFPVCDRRNLGSRYFLRRVFTKGYESPIFGRLL